MACHAFTVRHAERLVELQESESDAIDREEVERYRWMVEEYRVSVFTQQLGAAEKVSPKRLETQRAQCRR